MSLPPSPEPVVDGLWRDRLHGLTDRDLAAWLRDNAAWLHDWREIAQIIGRDDAVLAERLQRGAEDAFDAITAPLVAEAKRRATVRKLPRLRRVTLDVLLRNYPDRLRPAGSGRWKTRCPWHQDQTPSLAVYEDHVHCFACSAHHPLADLLAAWRQEAA